MRHRESPLGMGIASVVLVVCHEHDSGTDPFKLYASNSYEKNAIEIDVGLPGKTRW